MLINPLSALPEELSVRQLAIIQMLLEDGASHSTRLAQRLKCSRQLVDRDIAYLRKRRLVATDHPKIGFPIKPHRVMPAVLALKEKLLKPPR